MDQFNFSDYPNTNFNETNLDFILEETKKNSADIAKNTADIEELKTGGTIIDYEDLQNLPKINGVTLMGDKSLEDIGAASADELSDVKSAITYVTPEMFGAKGDGLTDDASAIQQAIDSGTPVFMAKNYRVNRTLDIENTETVIICPGTIIIDSDIVVFDIKSSSNIIKIKKIKGPAGTWSDGLWHFVGTAFKVDADGARVSYNELTVHIADRIKKVFEFYANGTFGTATNKCYFDYLFCEYGVYYSCGNSGLPWHNENQFFGSHVRGNYGVYTVKGETQTDPYNGNKFINFSFEGIVCAVKAEFFQYNNFENCRMAESLNGSYWIDLTADCHSNVFKTSTALNKNQINDLNNSIYPNVYIAQVFIATINGSSVAFGLGGNVYKQAAGWTADKVYATRRKFDLVGDGDSHDMPDIGLLDGWLVNVTRDNGPAYLNIPNGYGYGYGNGAEVIKLRVSSGNNLFIARLNGSNINKSLIPAADSGYYELRYMPNYEWVLTKVSEL